MPLFQLAHTSSKSASSSNKKRFVGFALIFLIFLMAGIFCYQYPHILSMKGGKQIKTVSSSNDRVTLEPTSAFNETVIEKDSNENLQSTADQPPPLDPNTFQAEEPVQVHRPATELIEEKLTTDKDSEEESFLPLFTIIKNPSPPKEREMTNISQSSSPAIGGSTLIPKAAFEQAQVDNATASSQEASLLTLTVPTPEPQQPTEASAKDQILAGLVALDIPKEPLDAILKQLTEVLSSSNVSYLTRSVGEVQEGDFKFKLNRVQAYVKLMGYPELKTFCEGLFSAKDGMNPHETMNRILMSLFFDSSSHSTYLQDELVLPSYLLLKEACARALKKPAKIFKLASKVSVALEQMKNYFTPYAKYVKGKSGNAGTIAAIRIENAFAYKARPVLKSPAAISKGSTPEKVLALAKKFDQPNRPNS